VSRGEVDRIRVPFALDWNSAPANGMIPTFAVGVVKVVDALATGVCTTRPMTARLVAVAVRKARRERRPGELVFSRFDWAGFFG
jgi:hypothetical protein